MTNDSKAKLSKSLKARPALIIGFLAVFTLVGGIGMWASSAKIAGAIIAGGMIEVDRNRQVIQHPEGGVVGEILVRDGDIVEAGDVVLRFDDARIQPELRIIQDQLIEVQARIARLEAERDQLPDIVFSSTLLTEAQSNTKVKAVVEGQARLFLARATTRQDERALLDEQIHQTQNQILGMEAQLTATRRQAELIEEERLSTQELFDKGLVQAPRLAEVERSAAGIEGQIGNASANVAMLQGRIAEMELRKLNVDSAVREDAITQLRDLQAREIELIERKRSIEDQLQRLVLTSPVSGIVYGSTVFALQSVVSPAQPIMYIVPQDRPLVVAARIEAIHVDQVFVGQEASLVFSAFDQKLLPEIRGQVMFISADVIMDERSGISFYRAELMPKDGEVEKLGENVILPGMPVEAYIKTSDRTVLAYLVKPVSDYFRRAFREN